MFIRGGHLLNLYHCQPQIPVSVFSFNKTKKKERCSNDFLSVCVGGGGEGDGRLFEVGTYSNKYGMLNRTFLVIKFSQYFQRW